MSANILFPVGRLISGSVHEFSDSKDDNGQKKFEADGTPIQTIWFRVAIPKTKSRWQDEVFTQAGTGTVHPWGQQICDVAKTEDATLWQLPTYAFKITDGDSPFPDKNGKIINTKPYFQGNWVVTFSQSSKVTKPALCTADGTAPLSGDQFKCGYYVQVLAAVKSNKPSKSPGLYVNPKAVALAGIGEVIEQTVDTTSVGFGGALPVGAQPVPAVESAFGSPAPAPTAVQPNAPAPVAPAPAPTTVQPNAAFMTAPVAPPAAPVPPAAPAAPAAPQMTAKAAGASYESFKANGWTDDMMRQQGYLI